MRVPLEEQLRRYDQYCGQAFRWTSVERDRVHKQIMVEGRSALVRNFPRYADNLYHKSPQEVWKEWFDEQKDTQAYATVYLSAKDLIESGSKVAPWLKAY